MALVAILAVDSTALRSFLVGGLEGFLVIGLGLQVGLLCMIASHGSVRRFWIGFEASGLLAMIAYVGLAMLAPESMDLFFINGMNFLARQVPSAVVQQIIVEEQSETLTTILMLQEALLGLPQLLVALSGGVLVLILAAWPWRLGELVVLRAGGAQDRMAC